MNVDKMIALGKQSSAIRELFEYGKIRKNEIGEDKVFDFSIGNPNIPCPKVVTEKLIEILSNDNPVDIHGYSSAIGHLHVREAIANYVNETFNAKERAELVLLTAGAAPGLAICFHGLLNPQDEVIAFAPFWPEYRVLVEKANATLKVVKPDANFLPDYEDLEKQINEKTRIVVINNPNNPTGVVYEEDTITKLASILERKQKEFGHDIYLISDEPYRELIYNEQIKFPFITNYYNNSIITYSFSKAISLPGERIGYLIVGRNTNNATDVYAALKGSSRTLGYVCASTLFQRLIPHCLGVTSDLSIYKKNQEILYNHLVSLGYEVTKSYGAFYLFVKALEEDANKFSEVAKDNFELLLVPSDSFGVKGYVRISYCVSTKQIIDSLPIFEKLYKHYNK